jgi:hypothetical protein
MRLHAASRTPVVYLVLLFAIFGASRYVQAQTRPDVLNYEPLIRATFTDAATASERARGGLRTTIYAYGRTFKLNLEPNEIFTANSEEIWVNGNSSVRKKPLHTYYKGVIAGEPGSWVRVSIKNGVLDGLIRARDELYFVEQGARFFGGVGAAPMVMYRYSDVTPQAKQWSCALEMPGSASAGGSDGAGTDVAALFNELVPNAAAAAGKTLELGVVADVNYYQQHGGNSAADMASIVNSIHGVYNELGVDIQIAKTVVFTSQSGSYPFTSTTDPDALLSQFSTYKGSSAPTLDLAHLFTGRDLASNVVGIAWLSSVCHDSHGSGLSQSISLMSLVVAHEMGHNFGAQHDVVSGNPCGVSNAFIMNACVTPSTQMKFSSSSKTQIGNFIQSSSAACLVQDNYTGDPGPGPGPGPTTCTGTLSVTSRVHNAGAKGGRVKVNAQQGCTWTATSNASWITISSPATNTGTKTVTYKLLRNTAAGSRTGTLTLAGQTFTITQKGTAG